MTEPPELRRAVINDVGTWLGVVVSVFMLVPFLRWAATRDVTLYAGTTTTHRDSGLLIIAAAVAGAPTVLAGGLTHRWKPAIVLMIVFLVIGVIAEVVAHGTWPSF